MLSPPRGGHGITKVDEQLGEKKGYKVVNHFRGKPAGKRKGAELAPGVRRVGQLAERVERTGPRH